MFIWVVVMEMIKRLALVLASFELAFVLDLLQDVSMQILWIKLPEDTFNFMMEERHRVPIKLLLDEFLNVHVVLRRLYVEPNQNLRQDVRRLSNLLKEDDLHWLHLRWRPCPIVQEHVDQNMKSIQEALALINGQEDLLYSPKTEQLSDSVLPVRLYHVSQSLDHVSEVPNLRELITAWTL